MIEGIMKWNKMNSKGRNIASLLLLLVFLSPTIIKLEHHHEQFICNAKNEKHLHESHEKCAVCSFEFSVFSSSSSPAAIAKDKPLEAYHNHYRSQGFSILSQFSFLLRGPPVSVNKI
jgi:hypothetical protein